MLLRRWHFSVTSNAVSVATVKLTRWQLLRNGSDPHYTDTFVTAFIPLNVAAVKLMLALVPVL